MDQLSINNQLIEASRRGDITRVKQMIKEGANVNYDNNGRWTPLMSASDRGHLEIVKYLTESGANVNHSTHVGFTPLFNAVLAGDSDITKYLIEHGADYSKCKNNPIFRKLFNQIIKDETNKLRSELTKNYLAIERGTPQKITGEGKVKSSLPRNLLLRTVYEKPYQELCFPYGQGVPPFQLIALANILNLGYNIDITWIELCDKIKHALYLLL